MQGKTRQAEQYDVSTVKGDSSISINTIHFAMKTATIRRLNDNSLLPPLRMPGQQAHLMLVLSCDISCHDMPYVAPATNTDFHFPNDFKASTSRPFSS